MKLTLDNLKKSGAFTGAPVKREISWRQGDEEYTAEVNIKLLSYSSAVADLMAYREGGDGVAARIAASVVDDEGNPVFTVGDINGSADPERGALSESLTMALLAVIGEVNGLGKKSQS